MVRVPFGRRGEYAFKLTAHQQGTLLESYEKTFRVAPLLEEGSRLEVDEAFLKRLAERGGGVCVGPEGGQALLEKIKASGRTRREVTEIPLVTSGPWFFLLFLSCLVVEWWLRRRQHLV